MKSLSKVKTKKEKERDQIYKLAKKGDVAAMRTLREVYGWEKIEVDGKLVDLKKL